MRREIITENQFNGQPIRADENNPVIANIIQKFQEQLEYMTGKRCRVLVSFCIARFPQGWYIANPNEILSRVMRKLRQKADYEQTIRKQADKWLRIHPSLSVNEQKQKLIRYLLTKGYEYTIIQEFIDTNIERE